MKKGCIILKADITKMHTQDITIMIREWCNNTQEQFAQSINKSYSTISKVETGERNLYLHTFLEWCRKKDITVIIEKKK